MGRAITATFQTACHFIHVNSVRFLSLIQLFGPLLHCLCASEGLLVFIMSVRLICLASSKMISSYPEDLIELHWIMVFCQCNTHYNLHNQQAMPSWQISFWAVINKILCSGWQVSRWLQLRKTFIGNLFPNLKNLLYQSDFQFECTLSRYLVCDVLKKYLKGTGTNPNSWNGNNASNFYVVLESLSLYAKNQKVFPFAFHVRMSVIWVWDDCFFKLNP